MHTVAILPVKDFSGAKQRLIPGLSPEEREALAEAMFSDVLAALGRSQELDEVLVVTRGSRARDLAAQVGVRVVPDDEQGHNEAALIGMRAALRHRAERVLLVPGDCPALESGELDQLLARPTRAPSALIVPDRHGTGTNALVLTPPDALKPSFGPDSCERHRRDAREAGVSAEVVEVASLATDVDTPEDLEALEDLLVNADATRRLLGSLTAPSGC